MPLLLPGDWHQGEFWGQTHPARASVVRAPGGLTLGPGQRELGADFTALGAKPLELESNKTTVFLPQYYSYLPGQRAHRIPLSSLSLRTHRRRPMRPSRPHKCAPYPPADIRSALRRFQRSHLRDPRVSQESTSVVKIFCSGVRSSRSCLCRWTTE